MAAKKKASATDAKADLARIEEGIDAFEPEMAKRIRAVRAKMRKLLPTAFEMVWDNYNFFVIAYAPTDQAGTATISIASDKNGVNLAFLKGADLADPSGLLEGKGAGNRMLRLVDGPKMVDSAAVKALIAEAAKRAPAPFPKTGKLTTVLRSVSAKRRARQ